MNTNKAIFYYAHSNKMVYTKDDFLQSDRVAVSMGVFSIALLMVLFLILSFFG
jgi:hypothetical protein